MEVGIVRHSGFSYNPPYRPGLDRPMRERPNYYYAQSAVIPYRQTEETLQVLMIRSRKGKRWVMPKGIIEPDLSPPVSAAKEAWEEAGVTGHVIQEAIGTFEYEKWGGICQVQVYVMHVENVANDWPEAFRTRAWLDPAHAIERTTEPAFQDLIRQLPAFLSQQTP
jgi:phosphohistidine phosphatase